MKHQAAEALPTVPTDGIEKTELEGNFFVTVVA